MNGIDRPESTAPAAGAADPAPGLTDAPADVGNTSDLAEAERLEEERARRMAGTSPDMPDRAFDRITPQV